MNNNQIINLNINKSETKKKKQKNKRVNLNQVSPLSECIEDVSKIVFDLITGGGTALGPALGVCIGLLMRDGGEIIAVTDGESTSGMLEMMLCMVRGCVVMCEMCVVMRGDAW